MPERPNRPPRRLLLIWQLFVPNAIVLVIATSVLLVSPATISSPPDRAEAGVLIAGLIVLLAVNLWIVRRTVTPLRDLTAAMREVDPLRPGQRVAIGPHASEIVVLSEVFNRMLERLESERRDSGRRMLTAQESERRRVARELHDEVGQSVTALMLELGHLAAQAPEGLDDRLLEVREQARLLSEELRTIVRRLRPDALDDLGLGSALTQLSESFMDRFGIRITRNLAGALPDLDPAAELVIYRIAQESLTNVVRHSGARTADLLLERTGEGVRLRVSDDGSGLNGADRGAGIRGMRERALLLDANLTIRSEPDSGTTVQLDLPVSAT